MGIPQSLPQALVKKAGKARDPKCAFYSLFQEINCYLRNGTYSGIIMRAVVKRAKAQLKTLK